MTLGNSTTGVELDPVWTEPTRECIVGVLSTTLLTINGNTNFTRSIEIGDNTINTSLVMNHYGTYNLYGEVKP